MSDDSEKSPLQVVLFIVCQLTIPFFVRPTLLSPDKIQFIIKRQTANPHVGEAKTREFFTFLLKMIHQNSR